MARKLLTRIRRLVLYTINAPRPSLCLLPISEESKIKAAQATRSIRYEVIHFFKIETSCLIDPIRHRHPSATIHLDLDDIESLRWQRTSEIYQRNGDRLGARQATAQAEACRRLERHLLPTLDRVYVCSKIDKNRLENSCRLSNVRCLPNIYPLRNPVSTKTQAHSSSFCCIIVGSWGYYPNQDSLLYLCWEIMPLLRSRLPGPFVVKIIGQGSLPAKLHNALQKQKEFSFVGQVDELHPYYQEADAALVPLRAGGGTRLKILEAFAYGVPVVSTTIGAEGLEVQHDTHALIADNPSDFADQCVRLAGDGTLSARLSENAQALLKKEYSPERLRGLLCPEYSASTR